MPVVVQALRGVDANLAAPVAKERDRVAVGVDPERVGLARQFSGPGLGDTFCQVPERLCLTQAPMEAQREGFKAGDERTAMRSSRIVEGHRRRGSVSGGDERDALETDRAATDASSLTRPSRQTRNVARAAARFGSTAASTV